MTTARPATLPRNAAPVHLRILATTDLHAALRAYDYFSDKPMETVGLTRVASLIRAARLEVANSLLFDNGDLLQGNPMGDFIAQTNVSPNPFVAALNALKVDAATLGNHDFNFGLDYLTSALAEANYPIVAGNIVQKLGETPARDKAFLLPWTLLNREVLDREGQTRRLRIGVLGLVPPQVVDWDRDHVEGHIFSRPVLDAARHHLTQMKASGADVTVVLAHGGLGEEGEGPENVGHSLAQLDGVDALVLGHVHKLLPDPKSDTRSQRGLIHGKPAIMAQALGSHLGVIDLTLLETTTGWSVANAQASTRPIARRGASGKVEALVKDDPEIERLTRPAHDAALARIREVVAHSDWNLHSYFSYLGYDTATLTVTSALRRIAADMTRGTAEEDLPILAAGASYMCGGPSGPEHYTDVPAGEIALRELADLYLFPDRLTLLRVTGRELRGWLERAAAAFRVIEPGMQDAVLKDPTAPSYHFDLIHGLRYRIDLSQKPLFSTMGAPLGSGPGRIRDLSHAGQPLRDTDSFVVATNNYRAGGGGRFPGAHSDNVVQSRPELIPDLLRHFLATPGRARRPEPIWSYLPMPGTSVTLRTGPGARRHLSDVAHLAVTPLDLDPEGFLRLRLEL